MSFWRRATMTAIPLLMLTGCAGSQSSSDVADFRIADLPPNVYAEAQRLTALPSGACDKACARRLVVALRSSELRKHRAIKSAIAAHDKAQRHAASRSGKRKVKRDA